MNDLSLPQISTVIPKHRTVRYLRLMSLRKGSIAEQCVWQLILILAQLWQLTLAHLWQFAKQGGIEIRWASGWSVAEARSPARTEVFGSERLIGALLDRITHHLHILEMNGDSLRLKQSRRKRNPPPDR